MSIFAEDISRKVIRMLNSVVDFIVLAIILILVAFAGYALWDSKQVYQEADKSIYEVYKPTVENEGKTFKELQVINPEVIAWLTVFGTNIDYPVTQGQDNMKYVNTNAEGRYSLSGSIFLDCANSKDFSDFNHVVYGHHMARKAMFGEISNFSDNATFGDHKYGNLYYNERDHGIEFFAFLHTDAYDGEVFNANVIGDEKRQIYLDELLKNAILKRDIGVTILDHVILLTTCSSDSTNGRDILIGRITDEVYEDTFADTGANDGRNQANVNGLSRLLDRIPLWQLILISALVIVVLLVIIRNIRMKRKQGRERPHEK